MWAWRLKSLLKKVGERRLIFCISPARAGAKYLSRILHTSRDVKSFHEADPPMGDKYLEMVNRAPYADSFEQRKVKVKAIAKTLRRMPPEQVYVETNHMFIKTFHDVVLDAFKNVDVIILRRDLAAILKSFIELDYFADKNPLWRRWITSPDAATAALHSLGPEEMLDQFDLAIAYLLDIEARTERFRREYPHVPVHEARVEWLDDRDTIERLFSGLRISTTDATWEFLSKPVTLKPDRKAKSQTSTTGEICRERIRQYLERAEQAGIPVPKTIAFEPVPLGRRP